MKNIAKQYLLVLLVALLLNIINAEEWEPITPVFDPAGDSNLHLGTFVNENTGWAVSKCGRIWKTNNGGHNWFMQKDSMGNVFADLDFLDLQCGWLSCYLQYPEVQSILLRTTNGGNSWDTIPLPDTAIAGPFQIAFFDTLEGYAAGWNNEFYYTNNAGTTWQNLTEAKNLFGFIFDIFLLDNLNGWAVGEAYGAYDIGTIISTEGGKSNWEINSPMTYLLKSVHFNNLTLGCAVGYNIYMYGVIMLTRDGGKTWIDKIIDSPVLNDVVYINDSTAWTIGDSGYIWNSQDSGNTWIQVESNTEENLNRIVFVNNNRVGYIFGDNSTILKYTYDMSSIDDNRIPSSFTLYQNYPNPFNPTTTIGYGLSQVSDVSISIYDIVGRKLREWIFGDQTSGWYEVVWDGQDKYGREVSTGLYIYMMKADGFFDTKKMMFLK